MGATNGDYLAFTAGDFLALANGPAGVNFQENGKITTPASRLLKNIQANALADDLRGLDMVDVLQLAVDLWRFCDIRKPGESLLRIIPGIGANGRKLDIDVLEIVTGDKPFLVDSVMGELTRQGVQTRAMFHPVLDLGRTDAGPRLDTAPMIRESIIQVHIDPLSARMKKTVLREVAATLEDVTLATGDWTAMLETMNRAIEELHQAPSAAPEEEIVECIEFLRWLRDEHFAFLGARQYVYPTGKKGELLHIEPDVIKGTGLGILRNDQANVLRKGSEPSLLAPATQDFLNTPTPLIVAKSNMRSRVHRQVYMDYIGIKRWNEAGQVIGETRFVGLFTAEAYDRMARDVPLIRRKVRRVLMRAQRGIGSHNSKRLQNIVENYPRDELFQIDETELLEISRGILRLYDRPRPKLFVRRDQFDRFVSIFVFVPRERYNTRMREQAGELLRKAFGGRLSAYYPHFGEGPLARVHFIIGLNPGNHPEPDMDKLEQKLVELTRSWHDRLKTRASESDRFKSLHRVLPGYEKAFSAAYREDFSAKQALGDLLKIEKLNDETGLLAHVYRTQQDAPAALRVKLYRLGECLHLSAVMPMFEEMGLNVVTEASYPIRKTGGEEVWVHAFEMVRADAEPVDLSLIRKPVEDAFLAVWNGDSENDGFNRLILSLGVNWRSVAFLRTCARYRQQSGLEPSRFIQEQALAENPDIAQLLLELSRARFKPAKSTNLDKRREQQQEILTRIMAALDKVPSLDHDKVLRRIMRLICASQRTNFYQTDKNGKTKPRISIKIASPELDALPAPKPYREIFVWSPAVEGVHLRFGPVARGGLRWSDRRDDFRTEVLGLVKAQQVKNSVIVPVGSKGGFFPKRLPKTDDREAFLAEGIASYRQFISGLLDITDTLDKKGKVIHPKNTVIWDGEDPYLVVAADKGTATFSDIANGLAADYGFWLDDAFASGGSVGYDHKKMGITAKGAWEAVKRHFREMGKDIQKQAFSVIGVGDMSGDVFGNGMLLSKKIDLLAAFDHRDIFLDPEPVDAGKNWIERKRLFDLPRSSWKDYDATLISKGGGIFSRSAKSIPLSSQIQKLTGISAKTATPTELMAALLKAEVELLWFGGIGTYIKSSEEQNWEAGDKANDAIRANADAVRAKVIGEGANLGITHRGRIVFALAGGRINADFVDNSAGVDTSDNEVNLKILLNSAVQAGKLSTEERNKILASMTKDVAAHVLNHNYQQTLTLSLAEVSAQRDMDAYGRFMEHLEADNRLDREVEFLPEADEVASRFVQGPGMSRPEIATLMAYAKNTLIEDLIASDAPDDPHFEIMLRDYFPKQVHSFEKERSQHRLRREIIATMLANEMIDRGGPTFPFRLCGSAGVGPDTAALCFEGVRQLYGFEALSNKTNALDNKISTKAQYAVHSEIMQVLRRQCYWTARRSKMLDNGIGAMVNIYQPGIQELSQSTDKFLSEYEIEKADARTKNLIDLGAPVALAKQVGSLRTLISASDVIDLSKQENWSLLSVACLYHGFGDMFWFDRLRGAASTLVAVDRWDRLAVRRLIEDFYRAQQRLTRAAMAHISLSAGALGSGRQKPDREWAQQALLSFVQVNEATMTHTFAAMEELDKEQWTLAKLAIANTQMRELSVSAVS
ncbi:NAD-specific glutamate dehydrogenase, large form [hydrothermal vent metagenome]|uniref:NAD-specific glutamate dehydrogenase, large form n=1 Tax=hydrothermal vent metagenome TaxID=652676 RepID=A0A3B0RI61_9ZZZZ